MNKLDHSVNNIIWDWNGTLLNDIKICLESINFMLLKRNLKPLTEKVYKQIFTFPVRDYYVKAGFDLEKEDFNVTGLEFIDLYRRNSWQTGLHESAKDVLEYLKNKGYRQFLVSAMEHDFLTEMVHIHGVSNYFDHIAGIDNHYAGGKLQQAKGILEKNHIQPRNAVFIGDTLHDHEVAKQAGAQAILVAGGHQSAERLRNAGVILLEDLSKIMQYL